MDATECGECGAAVANLGRHRQWHMQIARQIADAEQTADEAERKADESASILYNRGLD